jgi:hypothetical protein
LRHFHPLLEIGERVVQFLFFFNLYFLVGNYQADVKNTSAAEKMSNATTAPAFSTYNYTNYDKSTTNKSSTDASKTSTTTNTSNLKLLSTLTMNLSETVANYTTTTLFEEANTTTPANSTTRNSTRMTTTEFPPYEDLPLDVVPVDYPEPVANGMVTVPPANKVMLFQSFKMRK